MELDNAPFRATASSKICYKFLLQDIKELSAGGGRIEHNLTSFKFRRVSLTYNS